VAGAGDALLQILVLVALYAFIGGAIKYIDRAYDDGIGSLKVAKPLAVVCGVSMGAVMVIDGGFSTAFFLAMLISLAVTKKIDNLCFLIGTMTGLATFLVGGSIWGMDIMPLPLMAFLIAGIVDELADAFAHDRSLGRTLNLVLHYRPFSDIALMALIVTAPFDWTYLAPYFAFTLSYLLMGIREEGGVGASVRGIVRKAGALRPWAIGRRP